MTQARQTTALQLALALAETVFFQHDGRRVHDHQAGIAVDDDAVVLADQVAGLARAHHGGDVHAACHDGRVRGLAPHVGDKAFEHAALEAQHVGRRDVAGHQHQGLVAAEIVHALARRRHCRRHAPAQSAQQTLHHLFQVGLAFAQVGVFHLVKLARQHFKLRRQGPLGVVETLANPVGCGADQGLVLQQHVVHVEQSRQLGRRVSGQVTLEHIEFGCHHIAGRQQARDFPIDQRRIDEDVRHVDATGGHQHRATNCHATGYWQTKYLDAHCMMLSVAGRLDNQDFSR